LTESLWGSSSSFIFRREKIMSSVYFISPSNTTLFGTKYTMLQDGGARNLMTIIDTRNELVGGTHRVAETNEKYLNSLLAKWGCNLQGSVEFKGIPGCSISSQNEKIYVYPEDIKKAGDTIISFSSDLRKEVINMAEAFLSRHEARMILLPKMVVNYDYSKLPEVEGFFYLLPVDVNSPHLMEDVSIAGMNMYKRFTAEWTDYILKPENTYEYLSDNKVWSPITLANRPDIVLMPFDTDLWARQNSDVSAKFYLYYLISYMSTVLGENLFEAYARDESDKKWLESVKTAMSGSGSRDITQRIANVESNIMSEVESICRNIKDRELLVRKAASTGTGNVDEKMLLREKRALQTIGCVLNEREIVYKSNNVIIESNGRHYKIGDVEIYVNIDNLSKGAYVRMQNGKKTLNKGTGYIHPHISPDGRVCTGNVSEETSSAIRTGEISRLIMFIDAVLHSYNYEGQFNDIAHWPRCDEKGPLLTAAELKEDNNGNSKTASK
jgi:hypothetical protein